MKTVKHTSLVLFGAIAMQFVFTNCMAQTQQQSVNIVFTAPAKTTIIDTVIHAEAMHQLLDQHNLSFEEIHMIDLSKELKFHDAKESRMVFIEVDTENTNGDETTDVRVIRMDDAASEAEWREQAMEMEIEEMHALSDSEGTEMSNVSTYNIHIKDDGTGDETSVEVTETDGKRELSGTKNGKKLSEKEVEAILAEHEKAMETHDIERLKAEANREKHIDELERIESIRTRTEHSNREIKAVVIVKPMASNKTDGKSILEKTEMSVYPNPAKKKATVQMDGVNGAYTLTLTSMKGDIVLQMKDNANGKLQTQIDLEGISAGTYILSLNHNQGMEVSRLVVE